jgi:hypothetical protein
MQYEDYLTEAIDMVTARDIPDEDFAHAVNDQAKLMAGLAPDDILQLDIQ